MADKDLIQDYIKAGLEPHFENIPQGYSQKFAHKFTFFNVAPVPIAKWRMLGRQRDGQGFSMEDQQICQFLYTNTFATTNQLLEYFDIEPETKHAEYFERRLTFLVNQHILNSFTLHQYDHAKGDFSDALTIYCLDFGGKFMLANYGDTKQITNWYSSVNMKSSKFVAESLLLTQFYLRLIKTLKNNNSEDLLLNYKPDPEYRTMSEKVVLAAQIDLKANRNTDSVLSLLVDIVMPDEEASGYRDRMKLTDDLLNESDKWKYYFDIDDRKPLYIVMLTKPDEQLDYVVRTMINSTKFNQSSCAFVMSDDLTKGFLDDPGKFKQIMVKNSKATVRPGILSFFGK